MTIAQQIKAFYVSYLDAVKNVAEGAEQTTIYSNYLGAIEEAEKKAVTISLDHDTESTTYIFADGSCVVCCGSNIEAYGCAE